VLTVLVADDSTHMRELVRITLSSQGWRVVETGDPGAVPELVKTVRMCLQQSSMKFLVDAYCGVGFFAIQAADLVERFVGIELDGPAIKAARINAASRGAFNGEFLCGTTEEMLPPVLGKFEPEQTAVVLDPPRTGCPRPTLELLRQSRVGQVIYVSCHPATLARDLNVLCAEGVFKLAQVIPLDMFPQTSHVESVADLRSQLPAPESKPDLPTA